MEWMKYIFLLCTALAVLAWAVGVYVWWAERRWMRKRASLTDELK